jgi:hypothetical protein
VFPVEHQVFGQAVEDEIQVELANNADLDHLKFPFAK